MIGKYGILVYDESEIANILYHHFVIIGEKTANLSSPLSD
jgi:hypothetical protein